VFLQILINVDKTFNNTILQTSCMYTGWENNELLSLEIIY